MDYNRKRNDDSGNDLPMYSRLFIICDRQVTEDQLQDAFSKFGDIEDIRMPRDHNTGELKGIAYIKFSKASEAANALEEMNLKAIPGSSRPLKVFVAANRSDIPGNESEEKYKRIFIVIPKSFDEDAVQRKFEKYGFIEYIMIQKFKDTGSPKGFAYVKFQKFSEAARAVEECHISYKAIFALPKNALKRNETTFESKISNLASSSQSSAMLMSSMNVRSEGFTRIYYICSPYLNLNVVERLFDLIPGMIDCNYIVDILRNYGKGTVTYSNPVCAAYAVSKLDRFEYPPGVKMFVKPDNNKFDQPEHQFQNIPNVVGNLRNAIKANTNSESPDLAQLASAIAEASKLIKTVTSSDVGNLSEIQDLNYCSVQLPPTAPLADIDSPVAKRCFLICKPQPPPLTVLRDVFCRFGNLINVYTLPSKTVGYARYATVQSADNAIAVLHGAEICGVRIKVLEADEETPPKRKRYNN